MEKKWDISTTDGMCNRRMIFYTEWKIVFCGLRIFSALGCFSFDGAFTPPATNTPAGRNRSR